MQSTGVQVPLRKSFSSVDNLLSTAETDDEDQQKLLQRFQNLYSEDDATQIRDRRSFCGRLELLSTPTQQNVDTATDKKRSPDNMILSKTVRKEKRKQRYKREVSSDRWTVDEAMSTTNSTMSLTSPTYSTMSQQPPYLTTRYRDLTVKTPYFVDPSSTQVQLFCRLRGWKINYVQWGSE